jgi:hypothetical protein
VVLISPPKAGTQLSLKALSLLPGLRPARTQGALRDLALAEPPSGSDADGLSAGVDWPVALRRATLPRWLEAIGPGRFAEAHLPFSPAAAEELRASGARPVLMLRDPRDLAVSHAEHLASHPEHFLHEAYRSMTPPERLLASIVGLRVAAVGLLDVGARFRSVLPWGAEAGALALRFEDLVGPRGGGTREAQVDALARLARHAGARCSSDRLETAADQLFGGTATFRAGQVGSWRRAFAPEHVAAFKRCAGGLLIQLGYESGEAW